MDSALFFSPPADPARSSDDGSLSAWEIIDSLHLDSALVVLSSCSTARGRVVPGEGIIGLARAFQVAGARTVLVSQWPVPDRSTAMLMTTFYEQLAEGRSTVEALHGAQQIVAANPEFAHPLPLGGIPGQGGLALTRSKATSSDDSLSDDAPPTSTRQ